MVKRDGLADKLRVTADGTGVVAHAGSALLAGMADRVGLSRALCEAMARTRQRRSAHDPGVVLRNLVVMLADGGDCLADLGALRDQLDLYGNVASDSTAFRVIDSIDEAGLERLGGAVATARARAWKLGARPQRIVLDVDATLTTAYSDKEHAAGNFKKGYGHHPLLCYHLARISKRHWAGSRHWTGKTISKLVAGAAGRPQPDRVRWADRMWLLGAAEQRMLIVSVALHHSPAASQQWYGSPDTLLLHPLRLGWIAFRLHAQLALEDFAPEHLSALEGMLARQHPVFAQ